MTLEGLIMDEPRIHVFMPSMDGEYVPVTFTSADQDMKETEVLIFLDEETKHIYIWTGESSSVRKRFISSQIARQMRLEKGMTHRISTEDQGNETSHFHEFLLKLEGRPATADTLLEVSPAVAVSTVDIKTTPAKLVSTPSKGSKSKTPEPARVEKVKIAVTPPPRKKEAQEKVKKVEEPSLEYYARDEITEILPTKAKIIFSGRKTETNLIALHASSAASEVKISLYSIKKKTKTASVKTGKPIFVIYLRPNSASVFELDDLEIPIPVGNSIYYTCPSKTFIGINIE
ncbi:MAG: hypothetical protein ACTSRJ_02080 [Candidatus Hodarchaeales archaeon]